MILCSMCQVRLELRASVRLWGRCLIIQCSWVPALPFPQPLLDLVCAARNRLTVKIDEKLNLEDEGDLISSIIGYR